MNLNNSLTNQWIPIKTIGEFDLIARCNIVSVINYNGKDYNGRLQQNNGALVKQIVKDNK